MAQPSSFPAGIFFWNQSQIGRDLFAAVEPIGFPHDQHKSYRRQSTYALGASLERRSWGTFLRFLLDRLRQLGNRRVDTVQHLQQIPRRRLAPGADDKDSSCLRSASRHSRFL